MAHQDDIVDRLRDPVNNWNSGGRFEAADEIERLRAELADALARGAALFWTIPADVAETITCGQIRERYRAILAAQQDAREWQPIETAPKDGNLVLICGNGRSGYFVADARWDGGDWMLFDPNSDDWTEPCFEASHWRPLPAPPHT